MKHVIMDASGKVESWLKDQGYCYRWESQLIGESVPDVYTRKDVSPGWRYGQGKGEKITAEDCVFLTKCYSVKTFSATPQGHKAAWKYADTLPTTRESVMGTWKLAYTVEEILLKSEQTCGPNALPVHLEYRYAVVLWQTLEGEKGEK